MNFTALNKHKYLLLFLLCLLFVVPDCFGQYFKKIGMNDGLSNLSVLSIYQDTLGRMWFGTNEGVNVYDGRKIDIIKSYETDNGQEKKLLSGSIFQIVGNSKGDVFIRNNSSIIKYDIRQETFKEIYSHSLGSINRIKGDIWFTIYDSLYIHNARTDSISYKGRLNTPLVWCMHEMGDKIWIGTSKGLYKMENDVVECILPDIEIYKLFVSSRNELWISSRMDGLYRMGRDGVIRKEEQGPNRVVSEQIRDFVEDDRQNIWFGTFEGLQMYNPYSDTYHVHRPGYHPGSLGHQSVFSLCKDRQGSIWVGSYYGGVNYFNQSKDHFTYFTHAEDNPNYLSFPIVGEMVEDNDHDIWICTDGGGVNRLNRKTGTFTHFTASGSNSILHNNAKTITYDSQRDQIYIGTYTGGISRYDKKTGRFHHFLLDYKKTGNGPNQIIYHCLYHKGWLYVSSRNGLWRLNPINDEFELICNKEYYITFDIDNNDNIWLATNFRLFRRNINQLEKTTRVEPRIFGAEARITRIMTAKDGVVYITTLGNGVYSYDYATNAWRHFTTKEDNLLSDYCYNILETPLNNILITSDRGISIYSPFNYSMFSLELGLRGGISAVMDGCGVWSAADDQIYVGGVDGMIAFNERNLYTEERSQTEFYFAKLYINNMAVQPGDMHGVLKEGLPFHRKIDLSYDQNNLMIDFAGSSYVEHEKNIRYQYKLDGFDKDWLPANQMRINYTNLAPGKYVLKMREISNNQKADVFREIELDIQIHKPWFATLWAYAIYTLLLITVGYGFWRIKEGRRAMALSLMKERNEKEKIEELNKMKLRFFTNISHEFRTPLTLIIGQIEMLLQQEKLSPIIGRPLNNIYRNATNMRLLISELLDFRKQEQGFMKLRVECVEVVDYMKNAFQSFSEYARHKRINYVMEHAEERIDLWFDPIQLQKAVLNLLSNAFKHTSDGGTIKVSIRKINRNLEIAVHDSGSGISEEDLSNIFERFYQVDENKRKGIIGTGIGLALTKGIVDAHKGKIMVESKPGQGSCFRIHLQMGNAHFSSDELEHSKITISPSDWEEQSNSDDLLSRFAVDEHSNLTRPDMEEERPGLPRVLLVEDDEEILQLLTEIFLPSYNIYTATNGLEGFEQATKICPDLVVSDVMMPVMSGKEMCFKIKNCLELSYIPVVLLTAQATDDHTLEGYMFGADDYVTKPFNVKLLLARCGNLLRNKQMLLKKTNRIDKAEQIEITTLNAVDQKLLNAATEIIRNNFDNSDFDVNRLATGLNMGRSKMFTRLKEVVGLTPNELILKLKLEEAVRMLEEESQYNISEISYQLGFTSPRYFSRCFKAFYGVAPQNYRKEGSVKE